MIGAVVCSSRRTKREKTSSFTGGGGGGGGGSAPTDVPGPSGPAGFSVNFTAPSFQAGGLGVGGGGVASYAGFVIDYATSSQALSGSYPYRKVIAGAVSSGSVTGIALGTYYVRMATYDSNGNLSDYSNEITKVAS